MAYLILKFVLSAAVIVVVSEVAKRSGVFGALIASLPLTSLLAIVWLYVETGDRDKVANLTTGIFWLVLPSMVFFVFLPVLLKGGLGFWISLAAASVATIGAYFGMLGLLRVFRLGA